MHIWRVGYLVTDARDDDDEDDDAAAAAADAGHDADDHDFVTPTTNRYSAVSRVVLVEEALELLEKLSVFAAGSLTHDWEVHSKLVTYVQVYRTVIIAAVCTTRGCAVVVLSCRHRRVVIVVSCG